MQNTAVRDVLFIAGYMLHVPAALSIGLILVCAFLGHSSAQAIPAFAATASAAFLGGQLAIRVGSRPRKMQVGTAMAAAALGWLLVGLVGALPFAWIARAEVSVGTASETLSAFASPLTALFESMSGFTSTGLTMAARESELPWELHLWRSLSQWIGGFGIVILVITLADPSGRNERLFDAETNTSIFGDNARRTASLMLAMYGFFTCAAILALRLSGMEWWDAVNYGFTGVSTGGFGTTDGSLADQSSSSQTVVMVIMVTAAISFATYFRAIRRGPQALLSNQALALLAGIVMLAALLALVFAVNGSAATTMDIAFQAVSAFTTAGFSTTELSAWPALAMGLLISVMVIGAAAGSTAGGYKLARFLVLGRATARHLSYALRRPAILFSDSADAPPCSDKEAANRLQAATTLLLLWLLTLAIGSFFLALTPGVAYGDAVFEATSALGGVGLSSGVATATLPAAAKLTLIALMWLGRLEIIPGLVLLMRLVEVWRQEDAQTPKGR